MTAAVTLAHTQLLSALLDEKPHTILGPADSCDIAERREHYERVLTLVMDYVADGLRDLNSDLPVTNTVNVAAFMDGLEDVIEDTISGPMARAEELLIEDMEMAS